MMRRHQALEVVTELAPVIGGVAGVGEAELLVPVAQRGDVSHHAPPTTSDAVVRQPQGVAKEVGRLSWQQWYIVLR